MKDVQVGQRARVIVNNLGAIDPNNGGKIAPDLNFNFGIEGEITALHPEEGWWYLKPDTFPSVLIPIAADMMVAI